MCLLPPSDDPSLGAEARAGWTGLGVAVSDLEPGPLSRTWILGSGHLHPSEKKKSPCVCAARSLSILSPNAGTTARPVGM